MITFKYVRLHFLCLASFIMVAGCKSSTSPNTSGTNASGSLVFGEAVDEVATASLGSNTSTVRFNGLDPSWTHDGRIVYDLWGSYTSTGTEQIRVASEDGTSPQTIVDMQEYNSSIYANPKMSQDGKYVSFNYYDWEKSKLGTNYGTLIYTLDGQPVVALDSVWDASWAPDGSLVASGTAFNLEVTGNYVNYNQPGLFLVDKQFTTITPIGTGLTNPIDPSVSPNGHTIAFAMNNHIWTINMDGTGLKQITTGANQETFSCWSPDGNSIACVTLGDVGLTSGSELAIVSANPTTPTVVSQDNSSVWVKDNTNTLGYLNPFGNISWR